MSYYYYDKTRFGSEHCYKVDDVQQDAAEHLYNISDEASCAVTTIHERDILGYESLEALKRSEIDTPPIQPDWEEIYEVLRTAIEDDKLAYPFCFVRHPDDSFECLPEKAVNYVELMKEYVDYGKYTIQPDYYCDGEMTSIEADKYGMHELAKAYRQNGILKLVICHPYQYIVTAFEADKPIGSKTITLDTPDKSQYNGVKLDAEMDMEYDFRTAVEEVFPDYPNLSELEKIVEDCLDKELTKQGWEN